MTNETKTEGINVIVAETEKPYKLRELQAKDLFLLTRVISSLGIKKLADVFTSKVDISAVAKDDMSNEDVVREVGYGTIIEIVGVVLDNLPSCQDDLFKFLAAISNLSEKKVSELPLGDFVDMIFEVVQKEEFRDFFTRAARFLR